MWMRLALLLLVWTLTAAGLVSAQAEDAVILPGETVYDYVDSDDDLTALAEGYIQKIMNRQSTAVLRSKAVGERLTGAERVLYEALRTAVHAVAKGTSASTSFDFLPETIYGKTTYTAGELGITGSLLDGNGQITQEANDAIGALLHAVNVTRLNRALLYDCPFELYWYQKNKTGAISLSYPRCSITSTSMTIVGNVQVKMYVAEEYQASGPYEVNTTYGQAVESALANASAIISDSASMNDSAKLRAYMDAICDMVSYNHDAADGGVAYGNPWQMIWVFDGDVETKVVCEGYAKAFQYLCDQSSFQNNISVLSVQGYLDNGPHMWNVVRMEDGLNYLVDVTNCDEDSVGYPDALFLVGYDRYEIEQDYSYYVYRANRTDLIYMYQSDIGVLLTEAELTMADHAYGAGDVEIIPAERLTLNSAEMLTGMNAHMSYIVQPEDSNVTVLFEPIDNEICTVDKNGLLTAKAPGQVRVQASVQGQEDIKAEAMVFIHSPMNFAIGVGVDNTGDILVSIQETSGASDSIYGLQWNVSAENGRSAPQLTGVLHPGFGTNSKAVGNSAVTMELFTADGENSYSPGTERILRLRCQDVDQLWGTTQTYSLSEMSLMVKSADGSMTVLLGMGLTYPDTLTVEFKKSTPPMPEPDFSMPENLETIEAEAFAGTKAVCVSVPESVTAIGSKAFANCRSLQYIYIPAGTVSISEDAFSGVSGLIIYGRAGSAAESLAARLGFTFYEAP